MASSNELFELIKPVLLKVCEYYTFKKNGVEVKHSEVVNELNTLFSVINKTTDKSESLLKKYMLVEKPLVFFVDYFIKETGFSFSREYEPLARKHNELSGDDKFFDILDYVLEDKSADRDVLEVFYILLGLGFDGAYKREPKEVVKRIYECQHLIGEMINPVTDTLFPDVHSKEQEKEKEPGRLDVLFKHPFITAFTVLAITFTINLLCIYSHVSSYNTTIQVALREASPYKNMSRQNTSSASDSNHANEKSEPDDGDDDFLEPYNDDADSGSVSKEG